MPATVTLSTTTLTYQVNASETEVQLASVSGVTPGLRLFIDKELMAVDRVVDDTTKVKVRRGVDGSPAAPHISSSVVTIGRADQFYTADPVGAPASATQVSPYINVLNGKIFYAQGDVASYPGQEVNRWWQEVTTTYGIGPVGIRTLETDPTSST